MRPRTLLPGLILLAGVWAYHNSFAVPFLFDDVGHIVENIRIRQLWPLWETVAGTSRPTVQLSLAINHALGGLHVWGYHAFNLAVHLLAALTLFGIVRRTLRQTGPALAAALIWAVHPLHTQSVTYLIQRSESLMGLCFLFSLYSLIRSAGSTRNSIGWRVSAVAACAIGMGSKPVMVTAPVLLLLYDRIFLSGSFKEAFRQRGGLYLGLAASWLFLLLLINLPQEFESTAGFGMDQVTPLGYALTQSGVILHYLKLAVFPNPLVFDYGWPIIKTVGQALLPTGAIGILLGLTAGSLLRKPTLGFWAAWFFITLAPSSSFIPIQDAAFEYRMSLPLVGPVVLAVLGIRTLLRRTVSNGSFRLGLAVLGSFLIVSTLSTLTLRRNQDYQSELSIWSDTVSKRPNNARAHASLATAFLNQGNFEEAKIHFEEATRLKPKDPAIRHSVAAAWIKQNEWDKAAPHLLAALKTRPRYPDALNDLALVLYHEGKIAAAIEQLTQALQIQPGHVEALTNLGLCHAKLGNQEEAIRFYEKALRLRPDFDKANLNLSHALAEQGRLEEARQHLRKAQRFGSASAELYNRLGILSARQGKFEEAAQYFMKALELAPSSVQTHTHLGHLFLEQGKLTQALQHYSEALSLKPDDAGTHYNLGTALVQAGKLEEGINRFKQAIALNPNYPHAHNNLGSTLAQQGKLREAISHYRQALALDPTHAAARSNLEAAEAEFKARGNGPQK